jgi:signal transduction histidine kinase/CheY-like chemotaxis protein
VRLRSYLLLLTLATLLPVVLFGVGLAALLVERDRTTIRRGAEERTLAMITTVDAALRGSIAAMQALSVSPSLDSGDTEYFRDAAERVLRLRPDWANINLALPSGWQVANMLRAPSEPLPFNDPAEASFARALQTGQPVIGGGAMGPLTRRWDIPVRVPVVRDGAVKYVLTAIVKPASITELLVAQHLPDDWIAVVVDGNNNVIARSKRPEEGVGKPASAWLVRALDASPSGWIRGPTLEDADVYTPFRRSQSTGWAVAMGIPLNAVDGAQKRVALLLGAIALCAIGIAFLLARVLGARISGPIVALAAATEAVGRGAHLEIPLNSGVEEVRALACTLRTAARAIRERQQLIEREKDALRAADRAKDEFVAMLSHELRNPLVALTAAAFVLKSARADETANANARDVIERQVRHMTRLIEDLLDMSRVSMGKVPLRRETFDLAEAVSNVLFMWRAGAGADSARLSVDAVPVWIDADPLRIEQIFSNLLHNALKFTPPGKRVSVSVRQEDGEAVLTVADEGAGLEPELVQRMFEPFVQKEPGRGGLGLGLALVKHLTEMHGGSVTAASPGRGRGSVFTVRLPARAKPGSRRVLIVEDNDDARHMLQVALLRSGHEVIEACDGATGIALFAQSHPDVALIDIGLPDIDGFELARRLRGNPDGHPIALIALSGLGQDEQRRKALGAGFDAYLTKPVTPERLNQTIAALH